ncbi:MAG: LysR substrate-binding domain-containing protein [Pseudonocardiaceae bacterium]|jgi:DNA-binding transcriptional LysR family regulator|nr:LysR substrate-binding domain-containing protein [Pseudonocardiaceae bacterium]
MELRELRGFVAVVDEGALSAAARRMHLSQPALSQMVTGLERELGLQLLARSTSGVRPTEAGRTLYTEARAVLDRYDLAMAAMTRHSSGADEVLRIGVPLELPPELLSTALAGLAAAYPTTRAQVVHLSTAAQLSALRADQLDLGLLREHPIGPEFDAVPVVEEPLGVLLASNHAPNLTGPKGIRLDALAGMDWVSFPRSDSPAWYDELTAILRSHGVDPGYVATEGQGLIAEVKFAAVATGRAFALAPAGWSQPLPDTVCWSPLVGHPLVRRTWAVWRAESHRRDLGHLVASFPAV